MRLILGALALFLAVAPVGEAGPYYNAPPESDPETQAAMREFEFLLNSARRNVIDMFDRWEADPEAAIGSRNAAIEDLLKAEAILGEITVSDASDVTLRYAPTSEAGASAIVMFEQVLASYSIERPETFSQLLNVAGQMVTIYRSVLEETEITEFPVGWGATRRALLTDINVVVVGSAASLLANPLELQ